MFRRLGALLTLTILLFGTGGYYPLFVKLMQWRIREQMEHTLSKSLPDEQLTLLTFSNTQLNELHWTRHRKEFEYQGRRYDVARMETSKEETKFYCIEDSKETLLFANLDLLVRKEMSNKSGETSRIGRDLLSLFSSLLYTPIPHFRIYNALFTLGLQPDYLPYISKGYSDIFSPPPELFT